MVTFFRWQEKTRKHTFAFPAASPLLPSKRPHRISALLDFGPLREIDNRTNSVVTRIVSDSRMSVPEVMIPEEEHRYAAAPADLDAEVVASSAAKELDYHFDGEK